MITTHPVDVKEYPMDASNTRPRQIKRFKQPWVGTMISLLVMFFISACALNQVPGNIQRDQATRVARYPWIVEPVDEEHKAKLRVALNLDTTSSVCQPDQRVMISDLYLILEERFPIDSTPYEAVAQALRDFPVVVEESTLPDGTVTGRTYAYLLTQFEGYCSYFYVDLEKNTVNRIDNSKAPGMFDGPTPVKCGPAMR